MELNGIKQSIKTMLTNKKVYNVPRFQREYSWEINEVSEYFEDIITQIVIQGDIVKPSDYFIGSILLSGDYNGADQKLDIVDGQQRLTTITIFLSALSKAFKDNGKEDLCDFVWNYIIAQNDDGDKYPIFVNETPYPYFQYYIQRKDKEDVDPVTEEEIRIKKAYDYFCNNLEKKKLFEFIEQQKDVDTTGLDYIDVLKGIRDQILNSYVICIWTTEKSYVARIFEILNAKGKKLASIDLIKNELFSHIPDDTPDDAKIKWKKIKENLCDREVIADFSTFYRHYWLMKYKKVSEEKLYEEFKDKIGLTDYKAFLDDLVKFSAIYIKIINPMRLDYQNKKQYFYLVESLKYLSEYFGITQTRVALMALYDAKFNKQIISGGDLKEVVKYIEHFHFAYNAICTKRTNALESIYSKFAIALIKAVSKPEAKGCIEELYRRLEKMYPAKEEFEKKFIELKYSKKGTRTNMTAKYAVNLLQKYYEEREIEEDDGTIEHILSESSDATDKLSIGNLILIEGALNDAAETRSFEDKKKIYQKSRYRQVKIFCDENLTWDNQAIVERAKKNASLIYDSILKRKSEI